ncbi:MAG: DUF2344 domain-containing protein [Anaerolineae bacterium]|nr:DUF2344 domain-containing protein [Anaerolineae bacterium]
MNEQPKHRARMTFAKGNEIRYVAHLDLLRAWERILRRAGIPLAYSHGFSPHPRITLAMPSPVGCTGANEELDVILDEPMSDQEVITRLQPALPLGIKVLAVTTIPLKAPARPSLIHGADYQVTLVDIPCAEVKRRVDELLQRDAVEVEFRRKRFDLRPLIDNLGAQCSDDAVLLTMQLLRDNQGRIGRPDVVLEALGLSEHARHIHRTRIVFDPEAP